MIAISLFRVRWFCLKRFGLKPANQVVEVPLQPLKASEALRALEAPGDGPFLGVFEHRAACFGAGLGP